MAWRRFTKSQTGYLDAYWGLDSSGNCWELANAYPCLPRRTMFYVTVSCHRGDQ
jgi:hypothetical protein